MSDRYRSPFPLPTDREREILIVLIEEAAEIQHRATKALRFGLDESQPGNLYTNRERLAAEIGDLLAVVGLAGREGIVPRNHIAITRQRKDQKLAKYLQTDPES